MSSNVNFSGSDPVKGHQVPMEDEDYSSCWPVAADVDNLFQQVLPSEPKAPASGGDLHAPFRNLAAASVTRLPDSPALPAPLIPSNQGPSVSLSPFSMALPVAPVQPEQSGQAEKRSKRDDPDLTQLKEMLRNDRGEAPHLRKQRYLYETLSALRPDKDNMNLTELKQVGLIKILVGKLRKSLDDKEEQIAILKGRNRLVEEDVRKADAPKDFPASPLGHSFQRMDTTAPASSTPGQPDPAGEAPSASAAAPSAASEQPIPVVPAPAEHPHRLNKRKKHDDPDLIELDAMIIKDRNERPPLRQARYLSETLVLLDGAMNQSRELDKIGLIKILVKKLITEIAAKEMEIQTLEREAFCLNVF